MATEFLPQHRDHLGAEQFGPLESDIDREGETVDGEELALIVAESLLESEHLIDYLLGAADGQRGGRHVVLEPHATKYRIVLEVGPESVHRVL